MNPALTQTVMNYVEQETVFRHGDDTFSAGRIRSDDWRIFFNGEFIGISELLHEVIRNKWEETHAARLNKEIGSYLNV